MVSWMRGHEGTVSFISVHSSGRSAISTSLDTAQLWDLDTFQRKRKLSVRQSVGIQRVNMIYINIYIKLSFDHFYKVIIVYSYYLNNISKLLVLL